MLQNQKQEQLIDEYIELNGVGYSDANGYSKIQLPFHLEREDAYSRFRIKIMPKDCTDTNRVIKYSIELKECIYSSNHEVKSCTEKEFLFSNGNGLIMPIGDYEYTLTIENLPPNEEYEVKFTLLKDYSNMSEISKNAIQEAESENIKNSLCFTISDHILNYLGLTLNHGGFFVDKELDNDMYVKIDFPRELYWNNYNVPYLLEINENGIIRIKINTEINLFLNKTMRDPFAIIKVLFLIETSPYITKGTDGFLELHFINAKIEGDTEVQIKIPGEFKQLFESEDDFKNFTNDMLEKITSGKVEEKWGDTFIILLDRISIPSNWGDMGKAKAYFEKFYLKKGYINGQQVGFLIVMFSIYSLSGCNVTKADNLDNSSPASLVSTRKCNYQYLHTRIGIGISQNAINEIFKPFSSYIVENSFENGGDLSWKTSYWIKSGIKNVEIRNNGFNIEVPQIQGEEKNLLQDIRLDA